MAERKADLVGTEIRPTVRDDENVVTQGPEILADYEGREEYRNDATPETAQSISDTPPPALTPGTMHIVNEPEKRHRSRSDAEGSSDR